MRNWAWLCPYMMIGLATGVLLLFGLTLWSSFLIALLLVCPAVMVWGAWQVRRPPHKRI
jgi:hypothetical protein